MTPGCYGVPSVLGFESSICKACSHFSECRTEVHSVLLSAPVEVVWKLLRKHEDYCHANGIPVARKAQVNFSATPAVCKKVSRSSARFPVTAEARKLIDSLPKKTGAFLERLITRGIDVKVREAAKRGENGFDVSKHRSLHYAMEQLLNGGVTKPALREIFQEKMGWSESSAFVECSLAWRLLPAIEVAVEQGAALIPAPNVRCKNTTNRTKEVKE